jgi:hypothetical protein
MREERGGLRIRSRRGEVQLVATGREETWSVRDTRVTHHEWVAVN